ncbi:TonB-dependent receptor [Aquimarina sp. RZ0]|uniref:TonB-dependent receptor n=1 Tax=Aquimarina sp. RZ0 TaxID=2607730 RepID=UPI002102BD54|nr:TonB-dependent receptor [Aquimarina sp. RZ0]
MKLVSTFFMILLTVFCNAQEENNSIFDIQIEHFTVQNQSLKKALKQLEKLSGTKIGYAGDTTVFDKEITVNLQNKTVREILEELMTGTRYQFKVLQKNILLFRKKTERKTINGYIKEKGSGEHLPGVSIYIPELGLGTITNNYGFYSLTLPEGHYKLLISYLGYGTINTAINLIENSELNIDLQIVEESLEEVLITDQKVTRQSQTTRMGVTPLKISDVANTPSLLGEKDVLKTLQLLPGIQSGVEASSGVYIRGGTPDQNLIILDEAPVYNSNHLFGLFSVFNGDAIKSVEVFKGGFPARFGGRLSSVININMKDGNKEKLEGNVSLGIISSSALLEGPINRGKTSFLISARRTYADLVSKPFQPKDLAVGYYFQDVNFKIHHVFNTKNKLFLSTYYGQDNFTSKNRKNNDRSDNKIAWGNITSTLRWNHQFNSRLFSNTSLIFSNYKFKVAAENESQYINFTFNTSSGINDYGFKTDIQYLPNPKHTWSFGAVGIYHNFTPQRFVLKETGIDDINKSQELNSFESAVYAEDNWRITDRWSFSSGLRFSNFTYKLSNYAALEPRLTVAWRMTPDIAIKTSYSKMNQYIHLLTNSGIGLPTDLWVSSTDKVRPQLSEQIALGIAKDFGDTGYSLTIEGYYKKMNNVISYREGASFLVLSDLESGKNVSWEENITIGKGWAYGAEFLFRKQLGKLTGWIGYTIAKSERQFDELNLGKKFNARYDRRHNISLVGIYKPNKKITVSANWVYSSGLNYTLPNLQTAGSDDQFPIDSGSDVIGDPVFEFATKRNNFRGEAYHRLDLGVQFHKKTKRNNERTWGFSLYNSYGNRNPLFYYVSTNNTSFTALGGDNSTATEKTLRRYSLLVFIPSFNYTLKF